MKILFWLLPLVDVLRLDGILGYYRSRWGIQIPMRHAELGLLERWVGYFPIGTASGYFLGLKLTLVIWLIAFSLGGSLELFLMMKGCRPWNFFRSVPRAAVIRVFLLEAYNVTGYFVLGACLGTALG